MKQLKMLVRCLIITLLISSGNGTAFAQENGSDPGWAAASEKRAREEFEKAYKAEDWATVAELAAQLKALKEDKEKKAAPEGKPVPPGINVFGDTFDKLKAAGFSLRQDSGTGNDKPARFAYSKNYQTGAPETINADFYLKWAPKIWGLDDVNPHKWYYQPGASVEGKLSSASSATTDALRFRIENTMFSIYQDNSLVDGLIATLSLKEESDRDFHVSRVSGELWATVNKFSWLIGQYSGVSQPTPPPLQVRWRPYLGLDAGGTVTGKPLSGDADSAVRLMARGAVDVRLNFLSDLLHLKEVTANFDDTVVELADRGKFENYFKTGLNFQFNDYVGLSIQLKYGNDAPMFVREKQLDAALTIKF